MLRQLRASILAMVVLTLVLGLAYPLAMTGLAQLLWPHQANGSRVEHGGRLVGSALIGQDFRGDARYFQGRPSASSDDPADTGASELGPNSAALAREIGMRVQAYLRRERPYDPVLSAAVVPVDAVTSSASGVDPDISTANAAIQARRVAAVRGLPLTLVMRLVAQHTSAGGLFGSAAVNVLELNVALDSERAR